MYPSKKIIIALGIAVIGLAGAAQAHEYRDGARAHHHKAHGGHHHRMPVVAVYGDGRGHRHDREHAGERCFGCLVDRRQAIQDGRIDAGRRDGDLTRGEVRELRREQHEIAHMQERYAADGRFSAKERVRLDRALDKASREIREARTNDRERSWPARDGRHATLVLSLRDR